MKHLNKLLKPGFLRQYLRQALEALPRPSLIAVLDGDGNTVAMAGDLPGDRNPDQPFSQAALRLPLNWEGLKSGTLILEDAAASDQTALQGMGRFLAASLVELARQHQLRRSLAEETLEQYREMALMGRAVLQLNRSMRMRQVASALMEECEASLGPEYFGLMFFLDEEHGAYRPCGGCGPEDQERLEPVLSSRLFKDVVARGRGEFVNDLAGEERWDHMVEGIASLLVVPVRVSGDPMGALVFAGRSGHGQFTAQQLKRMGTLSTVAGIAMANALHFDQTRRILLALIQAMATAIDSRDKTTSGHSQRVAQLALGLARAVNKDQDLFSGQRFDEIELQELYYAGLLHDVGKIGVREQVLTKSTRLPSDHMELIGLRLAFWGTANNESWREDYERFKNINNSYRLSDEDKAVIDRFFSLNLAVGDRSLPAITEDERMRLLTPRGNLTDDEWLEIHRHPVESLRILQHIPLSAYYPRFLTIIRQHHERLDGSGYPDGISGDAILLQSRILAIVDVYDALCHKRHYKEALLRAEALAILAEEADAGKLDPDLVAVFQRDIDGIEASSTSLEDLILADPVMSQDVLDSY